MVLPNHFDNYVTEIASVHEYQTRLAALQKYYLLKRQRYLGQLPLKYWSQNLVQYFWKSEPFSPYSFAKQYKNVLLSCQNTCWYRFTCLSLSVILCWCTYFSSYHLPLQLLTSSPVHSHAFHPLFWCCCFFAYFTWHQCDAFCYFFYYLWNVFN